MKKIFSEIILFIISISFANAQMCVVDGLRYYAYSMTQASFAGIEDTALYSSVTSLKIPNTIKVDGSTKYVEKIKIEALYGFDYFEEITLPNGITSIEDYAFKNCSKLKTISMPNGMYSLGTGAFKGCSSLEKIDLSNTSIMQIPQECFYGCSSLDSLVIPKKANYLYDSAFAYCGIRYLEIENSNENIYEGVFAGCKNLETVVLPEQLRNLGNGTFADCSGLKRITLPNELTSIKANLFKNCSSLDSLELHPNITMIYTDAFDGCENLKTIFNKSTIVLTKGSTLNGKVAYYADKIISSDFSVDGIGYKIITVDKIQKAEVCDNGSAYSGNIEIPSTVTFDNTTYEVYAIGIDAFSNTTDLVSIKLPNTVREIKSNAFKNSSIEEISLGDSLKTIGSHTFEDCKNLSSITLPFSLTSIGGLAFSGCENLKSVVNNSYLEVTKGSDNHGWIAKYADVLINTAYTIFDDLKFYVTSKSTVELKGLTVKKTNITVPEKVTIGDVTYTVNKVASAAFKGITYLTSINLPSTLEIIGSDAFNKCNKLDSLTIPSNLKTIEPNAFYNCTSLKNITNLSDLDIKAGSEDHGYVAYYTNIVSGNKYLFVFQYENNLKIAASEIDSLGISDNDVPSATFMESYVKATYNKCPDNLNDGDYFYIWCKNQTIKLKAEGTTALFASDYKTEPITVGQEEESVGSYNYVDLGLPSGTKWATVNYEASCPVGTGEFLLYESVLELNDSQYTVPNNDDVNELIDNCLWILYSYDKYDTGYFMVIGPNGNHILLPTTGEYTDYDGEGKFILAGANLGLYWSIYDKNSKCPSAKWQAYTYDDTWKGKGCYNSSEPDDISKRPVRFVLKK